MPVGASLNVSSSLKSDYMLRPAELTQVHYLLPAGLGNDTAQSFIDNITKAFERAGGNRPMGPGGFGGE